MAQSAKRSMPRLTGLDFRLSPGRTCHNEAMAHARHAGRGRPPWQKFLSCAMLSDGCPGVAGADRQRRQSGVRKPNEPERSRFFNELIFRGAPSLTRTGCAARPIASMASADLAADGQDSAVVGDLSAAARAAAWSEVGEC